jgi:5'-3' exonuclease
MMLLELTDNKNIVLIDTSYYVFYRYFATMRWFGFQKKEFDMSTIIENEEYISSFIKHMESDLKKICKKWKTDINNVVFCADCQRCDIWRNDLYKDYKGSRVQNVNFNRDIFPIVNDYIAKKNIKKVSFDRLEADDIIYLMQKQIKNIGNNNVIIISNDNDYLQLADSRTNIINMQFKDITLRGSKNADVDLYHKAMYGDKSDNILKISPLMTKEKALEISQMPEKEMKDWLIKHSLIDQFNFNMNLISFELIPRKYVDTFYENVQMTVK